MATKNAAKKNENEEFLVEVACTVEGHEGDSITFDVSTWTAREFRQIPEMQLDSTLASYVEMYASGWSITGTEGQKVRFPGKAAETAKWLAAYSKISMEMARWLSLTPYMALMQASRPKGQN